MKRLLILVILLLMIFPGCNGVEKEISISKSTIQKMVEKKFPIEKSLTLANIRLFSPVVFFQDNSIGLTMQYSAFLLISEIGGNVSFKFKPVYKPENATFYMSDFVLSDITINNADSFIGKDNLMGSISVIVSSLFKDYPFYKLNPDDYKQNLAKILIKDVRVRGDNLIVLLSF